MAGKVTYSAFGLEPWLGREIAVSDWHLITQADITKFAEVTRDNFWIHTDPERAKRESPYKTTIAHGFFTLSLVAGFMGDLFEFTDMSMAVNYGLEKVRFMGPVREGTRVRARFTVAKITPTDTGNRVFWSVVVERENEEKPALVAELVSQFWK